MELLDFRNVVVLLSLVVNFLLLWVVFRYGRNTRNGRSFMFALLAIIGWIAPMIIYRAHLFNEVVVWSRLLYVMASFTSVTFFFFAYTFPDERKVPIWVQIIAVIEVLGIICLILHPYLLIRGVQIVNDGEDIILWGPTYILFFLHIALFFLAGFFILGKKFFLSRKKDKQLSLQILYVLLGWFIGSNLAMSTNLVLPWFGDFDYNWLGQVSSTILAVFTTVAVLKYKFLNIKLILTEGLVLLLNFVLFIQLVFSRSTSLFVLNFIILILVLTFSVLLIKSVKREIQRREEVTGLAASLEKANIRLQELDKQKTEFLSIAAHQLRTPLSIIKGYVELIEDGAYGKPNKKMVEVLGNVDATNEHLVKLIDEFLDISRIEQGRTKYVFAPANICEVIDSVGKELDLRAKEKGLAIVWHNCGAVRAEMDMEKVRHVIFNFVDNAIKYSEIGKIFVSAEDENGGLVVKVKDRGIGFDKTDQVNFYQKFYRGDNVKGTNVNGTGLGLYVCRKFIEAHGGKVWAHSPGLKKGSEFGFWLPYKPVVPKESQSTSAVA